MLIAGKTARDTYELLCADREPYLNRARQVAELTLPHLMPPAGYSGQQLPTPYQSMGARGVSSMSSKLLLALFPPGQSMMRYQVDPQVLDQLTGKDGKVRAEVEASLAQIEKAVSVAIESAAYRPRLNEVFKQYVVAGNVLLHFLPTGPMKVHHLDSYVVKRDPEGEPLIIIVKESISKTILPDSAKALLAGEMDESKGILDDAVDIYTAIVRQSRTSFTAFQEVQGHVIPDTGGTYKTEELPWIALRKDMNGGQSYAYGYAAEHLGDMASLEGLMKALVESAAASSRLVFMVAPNSTTSIKELNKAPNGSFVTGMPDDVVALKVDKGADMAVAFQTIERLQTSLGFSFLLNQSVQRNGERVTAEEIRFLAQELEDVQAGSYSLLAQDLQLPMVRIILARLKREKKVTDVSKDIASPSIVTGLDALSRGHDLQKLDAMVQGGIQTFGPEITAKYLKADLYFKLRQTALGLSGESLVRTDEEVAQIDQQQQMAALANRVGPEVTKQIGQQQLAQQQTPQ